MAHVKADRVQEVTASNQTGMGSLVVSGAAVKMRPFGAVMANNDTCICLIENAAAAEWEVSLCTYSTGANSLTRSTVYASSTGGLVNFSAGVKTITLVASAKRNVEQDPNGNASIEGEFGALRGLFSGAGGNASNVAVGYQTLAANISGTQNVAIGQEALSASVASSRNTAVGYWALRSTVADDNVAVGREALRDNTVGQQNTAIGAQTLAGNTTGQQNTAVGYLALSTATIAARNTAVGCFSLKVATGDDNAAVGREALRDNTSGSSNVAVGPQALATNTVGAQNVAIGHNALSSSTIAARNTAVGFAALRTATSEDNVAVGREALRNTTTGNVNVAIGAQALAANTTGAQNTALGFSAGSNLTTGTNNTLVGYGAQPSAAGANNEVTLGNSSISALRCQVTTITSLSDRRDKKNFRPLDLGIDLLLSIEPQWFEWNLRPEIDSDGNEIIGKVDITEAGFVAQQLQEAVAAHPGAEALGLVFDNNPDRLEATPGKLMPVFVKAFQELHARFVALEAELALLKGQG